VRSISAAIRNERTTTQTDPFQANPLGRGQLAAFRRCSLLTYRFRYARRYCQSGSDRLEKQLTDRRAVCPLLMTRCTSFQYLLERVFTQTSLAVVAGAIFGSLDHRAPEASYERISCRLRSSLTLSRVGRSSDPIGRRTRACGASSRAHLSHRSSRAKFWLIGAKGYEWS